MAARPGDGVRAFLGNFERGVAEVLVVNGAALRDEGEAGDV